MKSNAPHSDKILSDSGWKTEQKSRSHHERRRHVIFNYESTPQQIEEFAKFVTGHEMYGQVKVSKIDGDVVTFVEVTDSGD